MKKIVVMVTASTFAASALPAGAEPLPRGTYKRSCDAIEVDNGTLYAVCMMQNGKKAAAVLNLSGHRNEPVSNCNGRLKFGYC